MAVKFELFHLSLLERSQLDVESFEFSELSREEWLTKVFTEPLPFINYGSEFHFVPEPYKEGSTPVVGRIGRHLTRDENLPPEEGLAPYSHDTWRAAVLVLDPTHHDDGQRMAIQDISEVGSPLTLAKTIVGTINKKYIGKSPYHIEVSQIIEDRSFWDFIEENKGKVTSVSFEFIAPNMLGADDEFAKEMRDFRDSEKARKVQLKIENRDGIEPETDKIRRAVRYALSGRGWAKARAKGRKKYNSEDSVRKTEIDDVAGGDRTMVESAKAAFKRILGRE